MAGCTSNDSDVEDSTSDDDDKAVNAMMYVISGSAIPECQNSNLGFLIFVEDDNEFQYCSATGWSSLEIDLPSGLNGVNGTDGANGIDGINGTDGEPGSDGQDGVNGSSIISEKTIEDAGENCTYGGMKIVVGIDLDGDWQIDDGTEILTTFECDPKITYLYNYQSSENIDVYWTSQLLDGDLAINGYDIRPTVISDDPYSANDDWDGMYNSASSAFAKAVAINDASHYTGVYASAGPTVTTGLADISQVTLDSTNYLVINGAVISGFDIADNDAGISSVNGARMAHYTSASDIQVAGGYQGLNDMDLVINGYDIRPTVSSDDPYSLNIPDDGIYSAASAIAKAAAINDSTQYTGVSATVEPTVVVGAADISQVTLDSTNYLVINGAVISSFDIADNDAGVSSVNGPRIAQYTSERDIQVAGGYQGLNDMDLVINGYDIRPTVSSDDPYSLNIPDDGIYSAASAIAKAAAINDSTQYTGVSATVEPTVVVGAADISQVTLDSTNYLVINGAVISSFDIADNDAGVSSVNGPRIAQYTSERDIQVAGGYQGLNDMDLIINGYDIRATTDNDDPYSLNLPNDGIYSAGSAIAKAAAINDSAHLTGVSATVEPTVVVGAGDITGLTTLGGTPIPLNSYSHLRINGVIISGFTYLDNDAGVSSINGPRIAQYTSSEHIDVSGASQALFDQDIIIIPGPRGLSEDRIDIRPTVNSDDTVSTIYNSASAIAKATAINDSTQYTGVTATVEPTLIVGSSDISAVVLDSYNHIVINGKEISGITVKDNDATLSLRDQINYYHSVTGVTASLDQNNRLVLNASDGRNIELTTYGSATKLGLSPASGTIVGGGKITLTSNQTFILNGNAISKLGDIDGAGQTIFASVLADGTENLRSAINYYSNETGVYATLDENHRLVLTAPDGRNICVTTSGNATNVGLSAAAGTTATGGRITLTSDETFFLDGSSISKIGDVGGPGQTIFGSVLVDGSENLRSAINQFSNETGVYATLDENHRLVLTAPDGRNICVTVLGNATRLGLSPAAGTTATGGRITLTSDETFFLDGSSISKIGDVGGPGQTIFGSVLVDGSENLRSAINQFSNETGVYATLDENHRLVLTAPDGRNICVTVLGNATRLGLSPAVGTNVYGGTITLSSDEPFNLSGNALDKLGHIGQEGMTSFGTDDSSSGNSNSGSMAVARED